MPQILTRILDVVQGKAPLSAQRSGQWPAVRKEHLVQNPRCAACGTSEKLEVHHQKAFHLHPELELEASNLITLCRRHHLTFGHLDSFKSFNSSVREDAAAWLARVSTRPLSEPQT